MANNKIEAIKQAKDGLDVLSDIQRWALAGQDCGEIPADDLERLKWYGIFHRKTSPGFFMMRLRIPNGIATSEQINAIAEIAERCGRGQIDITTRQAVQLRWIEIADVPWVLQRLAAVGLTPQQTGMDNVRNIVGCPLAGIAEDEVIDTRPLAARLQQAIIGRLDFSNLPRKFNISLTGCTQDCAHAQTHDLSFTTATSTVDGMPTHGFNAWVGGALGGQHPMLAEPLDVFVTPAEVVPFTLAVLEVFRDHGLREKRQESRLKWLIQAWGIERFRDAVMTQLGTRLPRGGESRVVEHGGDHIGVHPQRQPGLHTVGLLVPVGRTNATQFRELAHLAAAYGSAEVRLTVQQNVLLPDVPAARLDALLAEPLLSELSPSPSPVLRGLVACTGNDYCHFSLIDTKGEALKLARALDDRYEIDEPVRIQMSGCPHACGQHRMADIGLQGDRERVNGEVRDAAHVFVGGEIGLGAQLATPLQSGVLVEDLPDLVATQIRALRGPQSLRTREAALVGAASGR